MLCLATIEPIVSSHSVLLRLPAYLREGEIISAFFNKRLEVGVNDA